MKRSEAVAIRRALDNLEKKLALVNEDAFNSSAAEVNDNVAAFRVWLAEGDYVRGDVRIDPADGVPYWALHDNGKTTGQVHQPSVSPTVWVHCHGTSPETARPFVAEGHNPYHAGHYCIEGGSMYRSIQDNNVYAPSAYPQWWEQIEV